MRRIEEDIQFMKVVENRDDMIREYHDDKTVEYSGI